MEPQIIDHYNSIPSGVNVIDKMNEELYEAQEEIEKLKKELEPYRTRKFENKLNKLRRAAAKQGDERRERQHIRSLELFTLRTYRPRRRSTPKNIP